MGFTIRQQHLYVIEVTIPKFPPPQPLSAQNKSSFSSLLQITSSPLQFISSTSTSLSQPSPNNLDEYPHPPPNVNPTTPTVGHPPPGNGYPLFPVTSYNSLFLTPP